MSAYRKLTIVLIVGSLLLTETGCESSAPPKDPAAVTKAMFTAINNGKAETAANFFAEDAELITGFGQPTGLSKIKSFFKLTVIPLKTHIEISELNSSAGNVTGIFIMKSTNEFREPTSMKVIGVVIDGKIKSMTWTSNK